MRQGCPLAPLLFILAADVFILMLKAAEEAEGLQLPGGYKLKVMSYANDNMLVICLMEQALDACLLL